MYQNVKQIENGLFFIVLLNFLQEILCNRTKAVIYSAFNMLKMRHFENLRKTQNL